MPTLADATPEVILADIYLAASKTSLPPRYWNLPISDSQRDSWTTEAKRRASDVRAQRVHMWRAALVGTPGQLHPYSTAAALESGLITEARQSVAYQAHLASHHILVRCGAKYATESLRSLTAKQKQAAEYAFFEPSSGYSLEAFETSKLLAGVVEAKQLVITRFAEVTGEGDLQKAEQTMAEKATALHEQARAFGTLLDESLRPARLQDADLSLGLVQTFGRQ